MYLFTTWTNGGASPDDFLSDVDVTSLVANWTADSSVALRVSNAVATVSRSKYLTETHAFTVAVA